MNILTTFWDYIHMQFVTNEEISMPFFQLLPIVTSCIMIVQYHIQKTDINAIHLPYSDLSSSHELTCVCVCVCLVLWNFITVKIQKSSIIILFYATLWWPHPPPSLSPSLTPGDQFVLHPHNFVISNLLYKWKLTACSLLRWLFFPRHHISLRSIQVVACTNPLFFFKWVVSHGIGVLQFNYSPLKDTGLFLRWV